MIAVSVTKPNDNPESNFDLLVDSNLLPEGISLRQQITNLRDRRQITQGQYRGLVEKLSKILPDLPDPGQAVNLLSLFLTVDHGGAHCSHLLKKKVLPQVLSFFSYSASLSRSLFKHPALIFDVFPVVRETKDAMVDRLEPHPTGTAFEDQLRWLRSLKAKEFIRISVSDYLKQDSFEETTAKISLIADHAVRNVLSYTGLNKWPVAVIAMGKWGGMELNYSSDIDLLFVASDSVTTEDLPTIHKLATKAVKLLGQVTEDGFVFRIDNRLRPEGATGALVRTINQYLGHYTKYALNWELQALVKARYGGGDTSVGQEFIDKTRPVVYNSAVPPEIILQRVRAMKSKIENALLARHKSAANVKLGVGGIRDIEFIIQFLQLHHGRVNSNLRHYNSLVTIQRLFIHRIITKTEKTILVREYIFLRQLEHCLQIGHELPIRQLPKDPVRLNVLGRKMGFSTTTTRTAGEELVHRYKNSIAKTRHIFQYFFDMTINFLTKKKRVRELCPDINTRVIDAHFTRLESDYFLQFGEQDIAQHIEMVSRLSSTRPCDVTIVDQKANQWRITIVANDYLGEFAVICGLFSAYSLNILSGESFTYAEEDYLTKARYKTGTFHPRRGRRYYHKLNPRLDATVETRKIVCVANVKSNQQDTSLGIDWTSFRNELRELIGLLRDHRYDKASEISTLKVIDSVKTRVSRFQKMRALPPIEFSIDNESDERYTILTIASEDKFMFLFEFANALAIRNYYIGKVEINTEDGKVLDRLFITTRGGKKIVSEKRLHDLTVTVTFIKQFSTFLAFAPNPRLALKQFSNFADCFLDARQQGAIPIIEQHEIMENLARILGTSTFLWEDFLRMQHQNLLPLLVDAKKLNRRPSVSDLRKRLRSHLKKYGQYSEQIGSLNRFKDREMFRIDLRHLTRRVPHFTDFCAELTDLVDVVMSEAYEMAIRYTEDSVNRQIPGHSALCALGKWGSKEIGYASDIELLFLWDSNEYQHYEVVEFFEHVAQTIAKSIKSKLDGIFELDFRLRPGGRNAPLATPFGRFKDYFSINGDADPYERQSLVRLRTVCGDPGLKRKIHTHRKHYVFGHPSFDIDRIRFLRERQEKELVKSGEINAKFSPGGLVDAEYFIQILQIRHGGGHAAIQCTNTMKAATALKKHGFLDEATFLKFEDGYRFLRALINGLRIVRGNAKDLVLPPANSQEFHYLVRRLESFEHPPGMDDAWAYILQQMTSVNELFRSLFNGRY